MRPTLSSVSVSSTNKKLSTPASGRPGLGVLAQVASSRYQTEYLPNDATVDCSGVRCTAINDFCIVLASASETVLVSDEAEKAVLAGGEAGKDETGNADKQSGSATDKSSGCHNRKFACEPCGLTFACRDLLTWHKDERHNGNQGKNLFQSSTYPETFRHKNRLKKHKKTAPDKRDSNRICSICGKLFSRPGSLKRHMDTHDSPRFSCQYCNQVFIRYSYLEQHEQRHSGDKKFRCDICSSAFQRKQHLQRHMQVHEEGREKKCEECGRVFVGKKALLCHKRGEHGKGTLYRCVTCREDFLRRELLEKHQRKYHTFGKPENRNPGLGVWCSGPRVPGSAFRL